MVPALMRRLYGSDDLFPDNPRDACRPFQSINYVTCHDGFTLYDLVSYNDRHNEANGHDNTDGMARELQLELRLGGDDGVPRRRAWPCGSGRRRTSAACSCLANGIPMFRAGDEFLQTQGGNNNPYNQDNATTWLDWGRLRGPRGPLPVLSGG